MNCNDDSGDGDNNKTIFYVSPNSKITLEFHAPPPPPTKYRICLTGRGVVRLPNSMNRIDAVRVQSEIKPASLNKLHMNRWAVALCIATDLHFAIHVSKESLELAARISKPKLVSVLSDEITFKTGRCHPCLSLYKPCWLEPTACILTPALSHEVAIVSSYSCVESFSHENMLLQTTALPVVLQLVIFV
jgi:hypothetical protein